MKTDLHAHSCFSDGHDTPEKVVECFKEAGVRMMALTDHDTVRGVGRAVAHGHKVGVSVIPGVEVTTAYKNMYDVHILGININHTLPFAEDLFKRNNEERKGRFTKSMEKMREEGIIGITIGDLSRHYEYSGYCVTCLHLIDYLVFEYKWSFEKACELVLSAEYLAVPNRTKVLTVQEGIEAIRKLGGIPVMAHPGDFERQIDGSPQEKRAAFWSFLMEAREMGLRGIEAFYPKHIASQEVEYLRIANKMELIVTAGTDYHGRHRPAQTLGRSEVSPADVLRFIYRHISP